MKFGSLVQNGVLNRKLVILHGVTQRVYPIWFIQNVIQTITNTVMFVIMVG